MPHAEALAPALLERVLSKLGLSEPPSPTLEGLRTLYPAWCRKVPFDNIRQLIHRRSHDPSPMPGGDATEFFEAWLVYESMEMLGMRPLLTAPRPRYQGPIA